MILEVTDDELHMHKSPSSISITMTMRGHWVRGSEVTPRQGQSMHRQFYEEIEMDGYDAMNYIELMV